MMFPWRLPEGTIAFEQRAPEAVLVELDGPQLITALDPTGKRYLGLFADRPDDHREMWLYAPITILELEALVTGGVSMRNAMSKTPLELIEYVDERAATIWRLKLEDVPAGILPVPDANLPVEDGAALLISILGKPPTKGMAPIFRCGGRPVRDSNITFGALSSIAGSLQTLWRSIADEVLPVPRTPDELGYMADSQTLRMSSALHASFGMVVAPDNEEPFRKISETYRLLARLSPETLQSANLSPAIIESYGAFLKTISDLDAEVFAQLGDAQAYIGAAYAARIRSAIRVSPATPMQELPPPTAITGHGFFHAADIDKRTFLFFDEFTNEDIKGKISKDIAQRLRSQGLEIAVGNRTVYDVRIERKGPKRTAWLTNLTEAKAT